MNLNNKSNILEINFNLIRAFADIIPSFDECTEWLEFFINLTDQFYKTYTLNDVL